MGKRLLVAVLTVIVAASAFAGCSKQQVNVKIQDKKTTTEIKVDAGKTVSEILGEAEISLGKNDAVTPKKNSVVNKKTIIDIQRAVKAKVIANAKTVEVTLAGAKVKDAIEKAGVALTENDSVNFPLDEKLSDNMEIVVTNKLKVIVDSDGAKTEYFTLKKTVGGFLKEQNIKVKKHDKLTPKRKTPVTNNMTITIEKSNVETEKKTEYIDYQTRYITSSSVPSGTSKVTTQGQKGTKEITYEVVYLNGKEKSRKKISEKITKQPVDKVVTQGAKTQSTVSKSKASGGKTEVSRKKFPDCDGSGHGYYEIKYSDGTTKYEDY